MVHNRHPMQIISGILLFVLGAALLGYTASRTLSFIEMSLPPDRQLLGYLALAAFDGGLIVWTLLYMWNAASHIQRGIALGMIAVSIIGVCIGFIADTLVQSGKNGIAGKVDTATVTTALWITIIIIGLNIVASFAYHLTNPAHAERIEEQNLRATIEAAARRQVSQNAEVLAEQLAPRMAADTVRRMQTKYLAGLGHTPQLPTVSSARQVSNPARATGQTKTRNAAPAKIALADSVRNASDLRIEEKPRRFRKTDGAIFNPEPKPQSAIFTQQPQFSENEVEEEETEVVEEQNFLSQQELEAGPVIRAYGRQYYPNQGEANQA